MDFKEKLIADLKVKSYVAIENKDNYLIWLINCWEISNKNQDESIAAFPERDFDKAYDFLMSLED